MHARSRGFALIELIFVAVIIGLLFFFVLTQSAQNDKRQGNVQRRADVNSILSAIDTYAEQHDGKLPEGITDQAKIIASTTGIAAVNLCRSLVPAHLTTIPLDPGTGLAVPVGSKCTDKDARYSSGYTVQIIQGNKVRVSAPGAEGDEVIFATN
jgi:type II secretory pathway pseudopilin PulG